MVPVIEVDLRESPRRRWRGIAAHADGAREVLDAYVQDLGGLARLGGVVATVAPLVLSAEIQEEIASLAEMLGRPIENVTLGNLYYDVFRAMVGCTAFAVDTSDGPLHSRNLDWWSERRLLSDQSVRVRFIGAPAGDFETIGWPGFIGAFSGVAPGRFGLTLNAVLSTEKPQIAEPITFLLRRVLETARSFDEAVRLLSETTIASDCLLLVTGTKRGEMVVIERTSTRALIRTSEDGFLCVTNDYRALDDEVPAESIGELQRSGGSRFVAATELARERPPVDEERAFEILSSPRVKMMMTVQQMVLSAKRGTIELRVP